MYVNVKTAADEVKPVLTADTAATAITSIDAAGASAKINLANGTTCTVKDLLAAITAKNATSVKMMTVGSLGAWVEATGAETIDGTTEGNFKVEVVSVEGVTYTWTIDVA